MICIKILRRVACKPYFVKFINLSETKTNPKLSLPKLLTQNHTQNLKKYLDSITRNHSVFLQCLGRLTRAVVEIVTHIPAHYDRGLGRGGGAYATTIYQFV